MWLAEFMTQGLNEMFLKILRVKWNVLKVYSLNETYPTYQKKKKWNISKTLRFKNIIYPKIK